MLLFDILHLLGAGVTPSRSKLHLATTAGDSDPLDAFFAGDFERWQARQGRRNFERAFIVALIRLPERHRWLFAGAFRQLGRRRVSRPPPPHWRYRTEELPEAAPWAGRLVVRFRRPGRASYLNAEHWASRLEIRAILEGRMSVAAFPGYRQVRLAHPTLEAIIRREEPSWKGALSAVGGVYVITDTRTGRLYVGSATGTGGIWGRWSAYAADGHGGNRELRALLEAEGPGRARHFQYAILEIADLCADEADTLAREAHWKRVLATREHGLNAN